MKRNIVGCPCCDYDASDCKLHKAAPALLTACKDARFVLCPYNDACECDGGNPIAHHTALRAAIAAAVKP